MRAAVVIVLLLSLAAPVVAGDPGGADGPDHPHEALWLEPGTYSGDVGRTDAGDWFRFELRHDQHARLFIRAWEPLEIATARDDSDTIERVTMPAISSLTRTIDNVGDSFFLGLKRPDGSSRATAYEFRVEMLDDPDFVVSNLTWSEERVGPPGLNWTGWKRQITFDVANGGPGAAAGRVEVLVRTRAEGLTTTIHHESLTLGPGDSRRFEVEWDGVEAGTIGHADIMGVVHAPFDHDPGNDAQAVRAWSLWDGHGTGVTAGRTFAGSVEVRPGWVRGYHSVDVLWIRAAWLDYEIRTIDTSARWCLAGPLVYDCRSLP